MWGAAVFILHLNKFHVHKIVFQAKFMIFCGNVFFFLVTSVNFLLHCHGSTAHFKYAKLIFDDMCIIHNLIKCFSDLYIKCIYVVKKMQNVNIFSLIKKFKCIWFC